MPFSLPSSPTVGQTAVSNGRTFVWDGYAWTLSNNTANHASTHGSAGSDPVTIQASQVSDLSAGVNPATRLFLWQNYR